MHVKSSRTSISGMYLETCETPKMKCFLKIVNGSMALTIFVKRSSLKVC